MKLRQQHDKLEEKLKQQRLKHRELEKTLDKKEGYIESFQSAGMLIGEVVNIQTEDRYLVKLSSGQ